ncbi:MAG: hypothetical protein IKB44_02850 [Clostridia bacterium]|nr:hypothetical protein [Clostridia bacterium]MBR2472873.1 hypothetical protein [Clostridia bacterium]
MRKIILTVFVCLFLLFWAGCTKGNADLPPKDQPSTSVNTPTPPHEHSWNDGETTKAADCKSGGVVIFSCDCGGIKTETTPKLSEHSWDEGVLSGNIKTYTCTICGEVKTETAEVPEKPVDPEKPDVPNVPDEPEKPDTPDEPTEPEKPTEPEVPVEPEKPVEPTPPPHEHNWDNGKQTKAPTCKEEGERVYTCSCGEVKTESIAKLSEHSWDDGKTEENTTTYTCTICNEIKTVTIEIPPQKDPVELPDVNTNEGDAVTSSPAPYPVLLKPTADGKNEKRNNLAVIDHSNSAEGYVMAQYLDDTDKRLKVQVKSEDITYTYNINPKTWAVFPLSEGNGEYKITVYRQVEGSKYSTIISETINATLKNDFSTFLYPNQYVDYSVAPKSVDKAYELTKFISDPLHKVAVIYDYVVDNITYDKQEAATVQSGYLPVLDEVLETKTGICFDYAALMTGMLRSQGVPCKLVVGYAGKAYHAWINVWTEESGWVDGVIFFDGSKWQRMDPTFASSSHRSDSIMEYIGDGSNYTEKYLY